MIAGRVIVAAGALIAGATAIAVSGGGHEPRALLAPGCDARPAAAHEDLRARREALRVPGRPFDVAVTPDGRWAFASLPSTSGRPRLAVLRTSRSTLRLVRLVRLRSGLQPFGLAVAPRSGTLLVAAGSALVSIELAALTNGDRVAPRELTSGSALIGVAVTRDGRSIFATDEVRSEVVALRRTSVRRIGVPKAPVGVALSPDERRLFVTSEFDSEWRDRGVLSVIDTGAALAGEPGTVLGATPAGCHPVRVVVEPSGRFAWVSARESHAVLGFDARALEKDPSRALRAVVPVPPAPVDLVATDDGRRVFVASSASSEGDAAPGDIAVVDTAAALAGRPALAGTAAAGRFPRALAWTRGGEALLVAAYGSRQVRLLDMAALR